LEHLNLTSALQNALVLIFWWWQVLRWGALVTGVFYGFTHQSAIRSSDKKAQAQQAWDRKVKLIDDAKAEYARKNAPPGSGDGGKFVASLHGCGRMDVFGNKGDLEA
jgi:hypothetical protein